MSRSSTSACPNAPTPASSSPTLSSQDEGIVGLFSFGEKEVVKTDDLSCFYVKIIADARTS
jgi:hypothetical protein